jgi:tetratricopeptide (TPR) repeat protein
VKEVVRAAAETWKAQPHLLELKAKAKPDSSGRRTVLLFVLALASVAPLLYKRHEERELEQAAMARRSAATSSVPAANARTEPQVTEYLAAPTPAPPASAERPALIEEPAFDPPARPTTGPQSANALLRTAITKARAAEWEDARLDVQHAIELAPRSAIAHYWRGVVLEGQDERGMAAGEFKRAIELDPAEGHAYRELANLYAHAGQHDRAIEVLGQLIARLRRWENGYAYHARGLSYRALRKESRARDDLKQACSLGTRAACPQPGTSATR